MPYYAYNLETALKDPESVVFLHLSHPEKIDATQILALPK
jgi:hypothetical protein